MELSNVATLLAMLSGARSYVDGLWWNSVLKGVVALPRPKPVGSRESLEIQEELITITGKDFGEFDWVRRPIELRCGSGHELTRACCRTWKQPLHRSWITSSICVLYSGL